MSRLANFRNHFHYDAFLSYSSKNKDTVRTIAERLKSDGIRVWFDEWEINVGESIPAKIEEGLQKSRTLVLCMSKEAFASDWSRMESYTFRFRDPLNKELRFIPLRLDDTPIDGTLSQFRYIDWSTADNYQAYSQLVSACQSQTETSFQNRKLTNEMSDSTLLSLGHTGSIRSVAISPDGKRCLSGSEDETLRLWNLQTGRNIRVMEGNAGIVYSVAISPNGNHALSSSADDKLRLWDLKSGTNTRVIRGHQEGIVCVAISPDGKRALSGSMDGTLRLWELQSGKSIRVLEGPGSVTSVAISPDGNWALSGSLDMTARLWNLQSGKEIRVMEGHSDAIVSVAICPDGERALTGSFDNTIRLWDLRSGKGVRVMEGHAAPVWSVAISSDGKRAISGSSDYTMRLWDLQNGNVIRVMEDRSGAVISVAISADGERAVSGSVGRTLRLWDLLSGKSMFVMQGHTDDVNSVSISLDGQRALSGSSDNTVRLWDVTRGENIQVMNGHSSPVYSVAISDDGKRAISGSMDQTIRLWDLQSGKNIRVMKGHTRTVWSVKISPDGQRILSGACDNTLRLWDLQTGKNIRVMEGHTDNVCSVAISPNGKQALSGSGDKTVRLWNLQNGKSIRVMQGHSAAVGNVEFSPDGKLAITGSEDQTIRVWDLKNGKNILIMTGHTDTIWSIAIANDGKRVLSGSDDKTVRLWDLQTGKNIRVMKGDSASVRSVAFSRDGSRFYSSALNGVLRIWDSTKPLHDAPHAEQVEYRNAKVLLVGNSSAGKTGLSHRLARDQFTESDSTIGAWATQWQLPIQSNSGSHKEIWLWDFGGQADQRLIHQLYMDHTQLAVLVFDPQKSDLLEGLKTWDRDLTRAATGDFRKLLVAGRIDAGGLRGVSKRQIEDFVQTNDYRGYIETSAKEGTGCDQLKSAICNEIDWDNITRTTTPDLFRRLKEEIIALKDDGRTLLRFKELREALTLRLPGQRFDDPTLRTVLKLLTGPGIVWELGFGSWVLLRPELINSYAQSVIRTLQQDDRELGSLPESLVLGGELDFQKDLDRLPEDDERILLLAMHRMLVENNLCLSEGTEAGNLLIFPSYARRERPELVEHPSVIASYEFEGFVDDIYATLVVRLHRISHFELETLWNGAADFKAIGGKTLGVKITRRAAGKAELIVYSEPDLPVSEKLIFSKYVHEHLQRKAKSRDNVKRFRHWFCPFCQEPVENRQRAMQRVHEQGAKAQIICVNCEKHIDLWDELEAEFADPALIKQVKLLEEETARLLDSESKERLLVGEVVSTVALAGQLSRELIVSDHGIDMEVEFKRDNGEATGKKVYLQLKSGDSYISKRKRDDAEIFKIPKGRHVKYWMDQAFPVILVIRTSDGNIRWMEIRDHLKSVTNGGKRSVRQIEYVGERFDVLAVRGWREQALAEDSAS